MKNSLPNLDFNLVQQESLARQARGTVAYAVV